MSMKNAWLDQLALIAAHLADAQRMAEDLATGREVDQVLSLSAIRAARHLAECGEPGKALAPGETRLRRIAVPPRDRPGNPRDVGPGSTIEDRLDH